jgi:hypothetical protein
MKKIFYLTVALLMLCTVSVKSQQEDPAERIQKKMAGIAERLYNRFEGFDRECFLAGTFDDRHYQTFTANKSGAEINDRVRWLFEKDLKFVPDTMRRLRITAYDWYYEAHTQFIIALFKNDYPDLRALRVCSVGPFVRHYGSEVKTAGYKDPVCNSATDYYLELFSSSLAKTMAGYCNFDYDNVAAVSSGGDIGYRGVINKAKIATDAQKMSFLAGVFLRCHFLDPRSINPDDSTRYTIPLRDSLSTLTACVDILKEFGCENVERMKTKYKRNNKDEVIVFNASDKVMKLIPFVYDLYMEVYSSFNDGNSEQ